MILSGGVRCCFGYFDYLQFIVLLRCLFMLVIVFEEFGMKLYPEEFVENNT